MSRSQIFQNRFQKQTKFYLRMLRKKSFRTCDKVVCKKEMSSCDLSHSKSSPRDEVGTQQDLGKF